MVHFVVQCHARYRMLHSIISICLEKTLASKNVLVSMANSTTSPRSQHHHSLCLSARQVLLRGWLTVADAGKANAGRLALIIPHPQQLNTCVHGLQSFWISPPHLRNAPNNLKTVGSYFASLAVLQFPPCCTMLQSNASLPRFQR